MTDDEALNRFGELLHSFVPVSGVGPSWAQYPYSQDIDDAIAALKNAGVTFEHLETYVKGAWDIARDGRLTSSNRAVVTGLLEHIRTKFGGT